MNTSKIIVFVILAIFITLFTGYKYNNSQKPKDAIKIGIIIPIEHKALNEIVAGFENKLQILYKKPIIFKIANAQGDQNLMRAIIEQMRDQNYDLIVPVATSTSQMAASIVPQQPIIALAADIPEAMRKIQSCNIAVVDDELKPAQTIELIHIIYPALKKLALVHSTSDKIFPEVTATKIAAQKYGISLQRAMVQNLQDLYGVANSIPSDAGAIFILKDSMIASGIDTLIKISKERKIPLITSDDGTVQLGAGFALGVHETQIGEEGAKLAVKILMGIKPCNLPIITMSKPTIFVNQEALIQTQQNVKLIKDAANTLHYNIENIVGGTNHD